MNPLPDGYTLESVAASARRRDDARQAAVIAEACFQSAHDPAQMPINDATVTWLLNTLPAYWNLRRTTIPDPSSTAGCIPKRADGFSPLYGAG